MRGSNHPFVPTSHRDRTTLMCPLAPRRPSPKSRLYLKAPSTKLHSDGQQSAVDQGSLQSRAIATAHSATAATPYLLNARGIFGTHLRLDGNAQRGSGQERQQCLSHGLVSPQQLRGSQRQLFIPHPLPEAPPIQCHSSPTRAGTRW
ncbi:hypothetical protein MRX96_034791 [Rhipicephalus microplus]